MEQKMLVVCHVFTDSGDPQILAKCNVCFTDPCQHGGTCHLVSFKQYSCQCTPGYHGDQCQHKIDACFGNPCENAGTCQVLDDYGRFRCVILGSTTTTTTTTTLNVI